MKIVLFILLLSFQFLASAATRVVFLNGIDGSPEKSIASKKKIVDIVKAAGFGDKFDIDNNIRYIYNSGDGSASDKDELLWQAKLSQQALLSARVTLPSALAGSPAYIAALGRIYYEGIRDKSSPITNWYNWVYADEDESHVYATTRVVAASIDDYLNAGHKVIIVAHSQGNFYAESANAYLRHGKTAIELKKYDDNLRFVGAASVAASTPNGRYVSLEEDIALNLHRDTTIGYSPFVMLARNANICQYTTLLAYSACIADYQYNIDVVIHGFLEIYTSILIDLSRNRSMVDILVGFINTSFDEMAAPPQPVATVTNITPLTATVNTATVFTVTGTNLPSTAVINVAGATCLNPVIISATTSFTQTCTSSTTGWKPILVSTAPAPNGLVIDASRSVNVTTAPATTTSLLTDTGITASQCYGAGSNALISCIDPAAITLNSQQDGMTGRDVTTPNTADGKLGFSYSEVPNPAGGNFARTECVKDNLTGLTWEGKPATGSRANANTLGTYEVPIYYVVEVNATGLCGFSDWRLPTADELQSLIDYSVSTPGPTIDSSWFPNTQGMAYWTATFTDIPWHVSFVDGGINKIQLSNVNYLRLVR